MEINKTLYHDALPLMRLYVRYPVGVSEFTDVLCQRIVHEFCLYTEKYAFKKYADEYDKSDMKRKRIRYKREEAYLSIDDYRLDNIISLLFTVRTPYAKRCFALSLCDSGVIATDKEILAIFSDEVVRGAKMKRGDTPFIRDGGLCVLHRDKRSGSVTIKNVAK